MRHKYFVSYFAYEGLKKEFSSTTLTLNHKIKKEEDIMEVKEYITNNIKHLGDEVVLLSFSYMGRVK